MSYDKFMGERGDREVWTFFYGSYMNLDVLREVDLHPESHELALLRNWDLRVRPRANLVPSPGEVVYGILATATHAELQRLYTHAEVVLGETYVPEAVIVEPYGGGLRPALCYISWDMRDAPAEADYVERILTPAHELNFPADYLDHIAGFLPPRVV